MLSPTCEQAVIEWPNGHRATLTSSEGRASWRAHDSPMQERLNFVLQACYDRDLSLERLARKCLAHDLCPPNGRLLAVHGDGSVDRRRTSRRAVALSGGWY